jgi:hypothetical protein
MILHCIYTGDFEPILVRFLSSVQDPVELQAIDVGSIKALTDSPGGGMPIWEIKSDLLCRAADPTRNPSLDVQIVLDIDIVFYAAIGPPAVRLLEQYDILFQLEDISETGNANIGVIAFRPSEQVLRFWQRIRNDVIGQGIWDQQAVNFLLNRPDEIRDIGVKIGFFPHSVWARSQPLSAAPVDDAILHHANCIQSADGKWRQLDEFRPLFERNASNHFAALNLAKLFLHRATWTFGRIGAPAAYGQLSVAEDGTVIGYDDPNERRLLIRDRGLACLSEEYFCTTFFSDFYYDPFRHKLLCTGASPPGDREVVHYLLTEV